MFPCKFDSPQVKRDLISSITNFVYELPHELLSDLRLKILGNYETIQKSQNLVRTQPSVQSLFQKSSFGNNSKNLDKTDIKVFLSRPIFVDSFTFCHIFCPRL